MKNKLLIIICLLFCSVGCAKITWKDDEFSYSRCGRQSIEGLVVEKTSDGTIKVKVGKQAGDSGALAKVLSSIAKVSAGAVGGVVVPKK